jgi:hypothetical protein
MNNWGEVPAGAVLPFPFTTYDANGASVTLTGLAVTDIEVYKGTSMTQRASDNGYALLDTDGIDIDGVTGFHGFSIDTGDNSDPGFYSVGSYFTVLVSAVTIAGQTVSFIVGTFRLKEAETVAGRVEARVASIANDAITAAAIAADAIGASELAADAVTEIQSGLATAAALTTVEGKVDTVDTVVNAIKAKTDNLPSDPADQSLIIAATDAITSALATVDGNVDAILEDTGTTLPATLATIDARLDTEIPAILAAVDTEVAAIKAKTDNLPASPAATSDIPSAAAIAAAVWASVLDGTRTAAQLARGWTAALLGKASGLNTGAASAPKYRDIADSKDVISAVTDASGNRSSVTLDLD